MILRHDGEHVALEVEGVTPGLRLESGPSRFVRLALGGETLAWARTMPQLGGVAWARVASPRLDVVPPITSRDARSVGSWSAWLAETLSRSPHSPLTRGAWALGPLAPRGDALVPPEHALAAPCRCVGSREALALPRALVLRWTSSFAGAGTLLPLRDPSPAGAARVKAWRKHARDGTLPPLLVLWLSAIDGYVLLDGHDRLAAARAEGLVPRAISVHALRVSPPDPAWIASATERYARVMEHHEKLAPATVREANERLVQAHRPWARYGTPARFTPSLAARFAEERPGLDLPRDVVAVLDA